MHELLKKIGLATAEVLLPAESVDLSRWAVVACDQYTSEPEYWEQIDLLVGESPSTLRLIYPEAYLGKDDDRRIADIHATMAKYAADGTLRRAATGFVYVERSTERFAKRRGLMACLDLEAYDYSPGSTSLVRATEGTILDRLPPRVKIRRNAPLELPHILMLIDDPGATVIEPLDGKKGSLRPLYDTELMMYGGRVSAWAVEAEEDIVRVANALDALTDRDSPSPMLYAAGDGNHSLATARSCWLELRETLSAPDRETHPSRYALVELMNIHDMGLAFEPIHRVLFGVDPESFLKTLRARVGGEGLMARAVSGSSESDIRGPAGKLAAAALQPVIDDYLKKHPEASVDYIHGEKSVRALAASPGALGLLLPPMDKSLLFPTVIKEGALPRKTFSMGDANEKRYYMECRKIT